MQNNTKSTDTKKEKLLELVSQIEHLPTLPMAAKQILEKTSHAEFDINAITDLAMTDQVLTAKMLRLVNSAYYGFGQRIESLRHAFVCLGVKNVRNIVLTTSLLQLAPGSAKMFWLKSFWEHSFACGLLSKILAKRFGYKDVERAYLAGLLHDIGEIILIKNFPKEFENVIKTAQHTQWDFHKAEQAVMGISHTDFGPWLLDQWKMCSEISHVVARHHSERPAIIDPGLVAIVHLADIYLRTKGLGFGKPKDVNIAILKNPLWQVISNELNGSNEYKPAEHLEFLDSQLEDLTHSIRMIYD